MVGLIIASHGEFCEGLKKTAEMFTGPIAQCMALPLQPGMTGEAYDVILEEAIDALDEGQGVVAMTDLKGGTPFNRCAGMVFRGKRIRVLTGMNLPMVMSVGLMLDRNIPMEEIAKEALEAAASGISAINKD